VVLIASIGTHGQTWCVAEKARKKATKKAAINRVAKKSLAETHPHLAKEADGWDATEFTPQSGQKMPWVCARKHRWEARIQSRSNGRGCPFCSNTKVLSGYNDLASQLPNIAEEADGWNASEVYFKSSQVKSWVCPVGHKYKTSVYSRAEGTGCNICASKKVLVGFNDLKSKHPALSKEAFGWDASTLTSGSSKKVKWKCKAGHIFEMSPKDRVSGASCPICQNRLVVAGINDLMTVNTTLARQALGWDVTKYSEGSKVKKTWKCDLGHVWDATIASRSKGTGCPYCGGLKVYPGLNDFGTKYPELIKEADGWDVSKVTSRSAKKMPWICPKGHRYDMSLHHRGGGEGCPYCSGNKILIGFNDLATTHPKLSLEADGWDAKTVSFGSNVKKRWVCTNGHKWTAIVSSRANGRGCPSCSKSGFDPNQNGYLYLLQHEIWQLFKIGISNSATQRTDDHETRGWATLEVRGPMDGLLTYEWEQSILRMLKIRGADLGRENIAGKFDGYTESWTASSFPVNSIKQLMDLVHETEL